MAEPGSPPAALRSSSGFIRAPCCDLLDERRRRQTIRAATVTTLGAVETMGLEPTTPCLQSLKE